MNTKLTTKTQYAVAAMLELAKARSENNKSLSVNTISVSQLIDAYYLGSIFLALRKHKLVLSTRGANGGYKLARPIEDIAISEIMNAVGEKVKVTRCHGKNNSCTGKAKRCSAHSMWQTLENKIENYFASITLYDLITENKKFDLQELDEKINANVLL
jgi:Rrf2 family iron-sulfur cluster assembly transcriptional regulator